MLYLDANFFVFCNFDQTEKGVNARKILQKIIDGKASATSTLALDEVMWVILKNKKSSEMREVIESIYSVKNLDVKEVGPQIPLMALDFIENEKLKPRDAFHAAVMKVIGASEIVSDDSDFDRVKWIKRIKF